MSCSRFDMFKSIARSDRQNGPRGGVAILSRLTCNILAEEISSDDFDFAAAAVIQLPGGWRWAFGSNEFARICSLSLRSK